MRRQFSYFFRPSNEDIQKMWEDCIFVFDTNVLLDLYRYTDGTRESLFSVFDYYSDRIWLPHQVGLEFHKNRISVIIEQREAYKKISSELKELSHKVMADLEGKLQKYKQHPAIEMDKLLHKINGAWEASVQALAKQESEHPDLRNDDTVFKKLEELFEGKIGPPFTKEELDKILKEAERRYSISFPPGYKDAKEKKGQITKFEDLIIEDQFGDFIIWKQIIQMAKTEKRPVIFVTGDTKEDWFETIRGKTQGPRFELLYEFRKETNNQFYMYRTDKFIDYAQAALSQSIQDEMVQGISEFRKVTEKKPKPLLNDSIGAILEEIRNTERSRYENNKASIENVEWHPGDIARHPKWGEGFVLRVLHDEDHTELRIGFPEPVGVQTLLARYAPLVKVDRGDNS
ncbi:PIN domain-containing protein [Brevibacillus parabrevis]